MLFFVGKSCSVVIRAIVEITFRKGCCKIKKWKNSKASDWLNMVARWRCWTITSIILWSVRGQKLSLIYITFNRIWTSEEGFKLISLVEIFVSKKSAYWLFFYSDEGGPNSVTFNVWLCWGIARAASITSFLAFTFRRWWYMQPSLRLIS